LSIEKTTLRIRVPLTLTWNVLVSQMPPPVIFAEPLTLPTHAGAFGVSAQLPVNG
jgi:hypothetical protein